MTSWQPSADIKTLRARAEILQKIRAFFAERGVVEVETPALSAATVTDLHLASFETEFSSPISPDNRVLFLQTSPEYAMKRLLCAGSGSIYQICKAFRNEEAGRMHNPEFSMLEWYRVGFDHHELMNEVNELMQLVVGCGQAETISYQQAFVEYLQVDPLTADLHLLRELASQQGYAEIAAQEDDKDTLLQLLFVEKIEPKIGRQQPCFVFGFPASQSALARINKNDPRVADRFELYFKGIELANGFYELADAKEQRVRFESDNQKRVGHGLPAKPIDQNLLAALEHGLPDCAGVALGLDRLIMLALGLDSVAETMAFSIDKA